MKGCGEGTHLALLKKAAVALSAKAITIANISIRQDQEGRYCINDLHKAAGSARKDEPASWLKLGATDDLRYELKEAAFAQVTKSIREFAYRPSVVVLKGGQEQGTYAVKELVYAYAMWISAKFHLQVIRAYDTLVNTPPASLPTSYREAVMLAVERYEQLEAAKAIGMGPKELMGLLRQDKVLCHDHQYQGQCSNMSFAKAVVSPL